MSLKNSSKKNLLARGHILGCNKKIYLKRSPVSLENNKETSFYASRKRGSFSIEAAIVMPLFITLMMFGVFLFRVIQVETGVQKAIDAATRKASVEEVLVGEDISDEALLASTIAYADVQIKKNHVPVTYISSGLLGIDYLSSSAKGNYIDLTAKYSIKFPIGLLGKYNYRIEQKSVSRKWIGYDSEENAWDGEYVYVTPYGTVYHRNYNCPYLNPSIRQVSLSSIKSLRNESGAKYYACGCVKKNSSVVYITDYGRQYHSDLNCRKLKRTVNKVLYDEVKDRMPACSKCCGE